MTETITNWFADFKADFILNFIDGNRWQLLLDGLASTLKITACAVLLGIAIGIVIAAIRSSHDKNQTKLRGVGGFILKFFNAVAKLYLTVIRGTPVVVQLMIMYFVIFASSNNKFLIAVLAFGINSGAYVAEIFRSGIMAVDEGQMGQDARSVSTISRLWFTLSFHRLSRLFFRLLRTNLSFF